MSREIMQQALNALKYHQEQTRPIHKTSEAIEALEAALAQSEQEPEHNHLSDAMSVLADVNADLIKEAKLAQPEQEPVAWMCENAVGYKYFRWKKPPNHFKSTPLYTTPPRKPWQGLTDSDMHAIRDDAFVKNVDDIEWALQMARRIESKLKERNGG